MLILLSHSLKDGYTGKRGRYLQNCEEVRENQVQMETLCVCVRVCCCLYVDIPDVVQRDSYSLGTMSRLRTAKEASISTSTSIQLALCTNELWYVSSGSHLLADTERPLVTCKLHRHVHRCLIQIVN